MGRVNNPILKPQLALYFKGGQLFCGREEVILRIMEVQITCVSKPSGDLQNPHEAISEYGWVNPKDGSLGITARENMVDWARKYGNKAFVQDEVGNKVYCDVRQNQNGTEYLQTFSDGKWSNNLLSLESCRV